MKTAMGIWTRTDPEAASTYLAKMPEGDTKDHAVAAFSQTGAAENHAASAAWAETISDATLREQSLIAVARDWMRKDSESALIWLKESGLSQDALSRINSS